MQMLSNNFSLLFPILNLFSLFISTYHPTKFAMNLLKILLKLFSKMSQLFNFILILVQFLYVRKVEKIYYRKYKIS